MKDFWANKKVLITGGSGFIGKHLSCLLNKKRAELSLITHSPATLDSTNIYSQVFVGDIGDISFINKILKDKHYDVCFHLASQSLVEEAAINPIPSFEVNIKGTWNILELTRQDKIKTLILASTAHVYGKNKLPYLEKYFPQPTRPYETSKACADLLAQTYANYYSLPIGIARCVNIYGPADWHRRIIPSTILNLIDNKPPIIYDSLTIRDYMYVEDAINGYLALAIYIYNLPQIKKNIIYNFGTGKHYYNNEVVYKIISLMEKSHIKPIILKQQRQYEILKQYVSNAKAKEMLGWQPKVAFEQGLQQTIKWYIANYK